MGSHIKTSTFWLLLNIFRQSIVCGLIALRLYIAYFHQPCANRGTFFLHFVHSHGRLAALYRTSSHCCSPFFMQPTHFYLAPTSHREFGIWEPRTRRGPHHKLHTKSSRGSAPNGLIVIKISPPRGALCNRDGRGTRANNTWVHTKCIYPPAGSCYFSSLPRTCCFWEKKRWWRAGLAN